MPALPERHARTATAIALLLVFGALLAATRGLDFAPRGDEVHFWSTTLAFAAPGGLSLEALRSYAEGMTPLAFVLWAGLERAFGGGIQLGRFASLACAFAVACAVALPRRGEGWRAPLAGLGLLAFPYFLGVGAHLYTDGIASALLLLGVACWLRGRFALSALALAAAIATRQFAVAAPLALAVHELWQRGAAPARAAWIAPLLAAATLLGWIAFFGGLAPAGVAGEIANARPFAIAPQYALYFLACVGAFYVVPERLLLRASAEPLLPAPRTTAGVVVAVVVLFVAFPPLENLDYPIPSMGYLDRAARFALPDLARMGLFCALATLAALRFARPGLASALVLLHTLVMTKALIGWDKYALLLLPMLWYLAARGAGEPTAETRTRREA